MRMIERSQTLPSNIVEYGTPLSWRGDPLARPVDCDCVHPGDVHASASKLNLAARLGSSLIQALDGRQSDLRLHGVD